jgi:agmatine deiminase
MKNNFLIGFFVFCSVNASSQNKSQDFGFPPEWQYQQSVWLGWSTDSSIQQVQLQMSKALCPHVTLTILSRSDSVQKIALLQLNAAGIDTTKVRKHIHYIPNVFIRDAGPRFLKNENGQLAVLDFAWNNYGYPKEFKVYQYSDKRGEIDNAIAKEMRLKIISSKMVAEGGAIDMSNTMLMCFKETALQRNPGKSLEEIEKEYLRMYGKQKMIWLNRMPYMDKIFLGAKAGNYFGYGANGHVDEFAKFVNDSTIVIATIDSLEKDNDPVSKLDYDILKENLSILNKATDINGKLFKVILLPVPNYSLYAEKQTIDEALRNDGDGKILFQNFKDGEYIFWLPAVSYLNFFISNGVVLVPSYWQEGLPLSEKTKDEKVRAIIQQLFADRDVIQINPMGLNRNGGGMHCATQQQPAVNKH